MKRIIRYITLGLLCCNTIACESFLNIDAPVQEITVDEVFESDGNADAAVVGLYSRMTTTNNHAMNGFLSLYVGLAADEIWNTATNATFDIFKNNAYTNTTSVISGSAWNPLFNYIYHSNAVLEGLERSSSVTLSTKERLAGEMYFTRAIAHFYLVNLFGDVPLVLTTDYEQNRLRGKASHTEIYTQILQDLTEAEKLIPVEYHGTGKIRPNRYAVKALMARVYLFLNDYQNAYAKATEVIAADYYQLEEDLTNTFLPESREAIWQLYPTNTSYNTAEGFAFNPSSATARPPHALYDGLKDNFDDTDKRLIHWTQNRTSAGILYTYPYKYKVRSSIAKTEYNVVLRLAEQYLVRAEASMLLGQFQNAVNDINTIRTRAGLPDYNGLVNEQAIFEAIIQERRLEFFAEWGHRWLDLKRWQLIDQEMVKTKANWRPASAIFPIPESELFVNPNL